MPLLPIANRYQKAQIQDKLGFEDVTTDTTLTFTAETVNLTRICLRSRIQLSLALQSFLRFKLPTNHKPTTTTTTPPNFFRTKTCITRITPNNKNTTPPLSHAEQYQNTKDNFQWRLASPIMIRSRRKKTKQNKTKQPPLPLRPDQTVRDMMPANACVWVYGCYVLRVPPGMKIKRKRKRKRSEWVIMRPKRSQQHSKQSRLGWAKEPNLTKQHLRPRLFPRQAVNTPHSTSTSNVHASQIPPKTHQVLKSSPS